MTGLGDLAGGGFSRVARDVSADGLVVVGGSFSTPGLQAFRWTSGGGMVGLGDLAGGGFNSFANRISADGLVIVGHSDSVSGTEAFRWTSGGGMVGLGDLGGGGFISEAHGVNASGSVVVGRGTTTLGFEAFIWDTVNGMRNLQNVLTVDYGMNLTGWTLTQASAISADGLSIVGWGTNPANDTEAWHVTLPTLCLGDTDGDGMVGITDFLAVLAEWGWNCTINPCTADVDGDGFVGIGDFLMVLAKWGPCP